MAGAKWVIVPKNQFFHAHQPREGIFEICSFWGLIFTTVWPSFYPTVQGARDFNIKIIWPHKFILRSVRVAELAKAQALWGFTHICVGSSPALDGRIFHPKITTISPFTFIWGACDDMMMFSIIISGIAWQFLVLWWMWGTLMAVGSTETIP